MMWNSYVGDAKTIPKRIVGKGLSNYHDLKPRHKHHKFTMQENLMEMPRDMDIFLCNFKYLGPHKASLIHLRFALTIEIDYKYYLLVTLISLVLSTSFKQLSIFCILI